MEPKAMDNRKRNKMIVSTLAGALAGFAVSFALLRLIGTGALGDIDTSRALAAMMGAIYLLCGAFVGAGLLNPRLGAKFLNVEDADELREQKMVLRHSVFGISAFGLVMLLLAFAAPAGRIPAAVVLGLCALLIAVATFTSLRQIKVMDELNASVARETAATGFYVVFALGGGWATLAHLGFARSLQPLDWMTLFAASMLVSAFWVTGRRGLLTPR